MKNKKQQVYTRGKYEFSYYDGNIRFGWIFLFRAFLTCCASVFGTLTIARMLILDTDYAELAFFALLMTAAFLLLFSMFPRTQVVLFTFAATLLTIYIAREAIYEYLIDLWELLLDNGAGAFYSDEFFSAPFIMSIAGLMAFFTAFSTEGELRPMAVPMLVILFSTPAVVMCQARFYPEEMLFAAAITGLHVVETGYDATSAFTGRIKTGTSSKKRSNKIGVAKIKNDAVRYGNYYGSAAAAFVSVILTIGIIASLIPDGFVIDYREILKSMQKTISDVADTISGNNETGYRGSGSGYLSAEYETSGDIDISNNITASAGSSTPLLKITMSNYVSELYIRGDIGYEFENLNWKSISQIDYDNMILSGNEISNELNGLNPLTADYSGLLLGMSESAADAVKAYNVGGQQVLLRQMVANLGYSPDDFVRTQTVTINYLTKMKTVFLPFSPYSRSFGDNSLYEWVGDFIAVIKDGGNAVSPFPCYTVYPIQTDSGALWENLFEQIALRYKDNDIGGAEYDSFMPLAEMIFPSVFGDSLPFMWDTEYTFYPDGINADTYETDRLFYEGFVREAYLSVPESERENIDRFIDESGITLDRSDDDIHTAYSTAQRICDYFNANYKYSLTVDNKAGDNTYLGNFLFGTKSGHCALYATVMTLTLRELGIPARYVTGFNVGGPGYTDEENGDISYTVTGKDLHAWVEVYFRDVGWLPFDPTSSAMLEISEEMHTTGTTEPDDENPEQTTESTTSTPVSETTENTTSAPATETSDGGTITLPPDDEAGKFEIDWNIVAWIVGILVIIGLAAGLYFAARSYIQYLDRNRRQLMDYFEHGDPTEATAKMLLFTLRLLKLTQLPRTVGELPMSYAERVDGRITIRDGALTEVMPLFERTSFADGESAKIEPEEQEIAYKYVYGLMRKIFYREKLPKRLWFSIKMFGKRL